MEPLQPGDFAWEIDSIDLQGDRIVYKDMKHLNALSVLSVIALASVTFGQAHKSSQVQTAQKATIVVNNGFSPSTVTVKAGQPVRLVFDTKEKGCIDTVVFDKMHLKKSLKNGTKTVVTFTPKKAGTYGFHCAMNMMKGQIVAK